jgi:mRNA-degrading endonuclease toxin of MazEF toxin-antitoxin module
VPTDPRAGEVWFADLGMVEKSRPVLVLAYPQPADARALVVVAPLTSQIRGLRGEVPLGKPRWLPKLSAVNLQGLGSFDPGKLARHLGTLSTEQYDAVKAALRDLLRL